MLKVLKKVFLMSISGLFTPLLMSEFAAKSHASFNLLIFSKFFNFFELIFFDKSILKKKLNIRIVKLDGKEM